MDNTINQKIINDLSYNYSKNMDVITFKVINQAKALQKDFVEKMIIEPGNETIKSMNATFEKIA